MYKLAEKLEDSTSVHEFQRDKEGGGWAWGEFRQLLIKVEGLGGVRTWQVQVYGMQGGTPVIDVSALADNTGWLSLGPFSSLDSAGNTHPCFTPSRIKITLSGTATTTGRLYLQGERGY